MVMSPSHDLTKYTTYSHIFQVFILKWYSTFYFSHWIIMQGAWIKCCPPLAGRFFVNIVSQSDKISPLSMEVNSGTRRNSNSHFVLLPSTVPRDLMFMFLSSKLNGLSQMSLMLELWLNFGFTHTAIQNSKIIPYSMRTDLWLSSRGKFSWCLMTDWNRRKFRNKLADNEH